VALRDTNGDGRADVRERFGDSGGTGIQIYNNYLYVSRDDAVVRFPMKDGQLSAAGPAEVVVSGFPQQRVHPTKTLAFDNRGGLYVNIGNPANVCADADQTKAPAPNPCPDQAAGGGIWRFDANRTGQAYGKDGMRYSSGLRQANAMRWHPTVNALFLAQHGRNNLNRWPEYFNEEQFTETPAEELQRATEAAEALTSADTRTLTASVPATARPPKLHAKAEACALRRNASRSNRLDAGAGAEILPRAVEGER
jgi:hypothetical protein